MFTGKKGVGAERAEKKGDIYLFVLFFFVLDSRSRSHTFFYFEGTELCIGPDPYRKGSITGN